jgi:hypothetical protein
LGIGRNDLGIYCRKETTKLEGIGARRRKNTLRENHDAIVLNTRTRLMISHPGLSEPGSGAQDLKRSRAKLTSDVVAAMN